MNNFVQTTTARYLKIALDIAARIVSGDLPEGERLKGRSILSTEYSVSPETIRRSMSLLSDKDVVRINAGSGIIVLSKNKAVEFVKSFKDDEAITRMNSALMQMLEKRRALDETIDETTKRIISLYKFRRTDFITPVEVDIPEDSHIIDKSIGELQIWHNTGATIIGIVRVSSVLISPGPYFAFSPGDKVLIVGDENVIARFNAFVIGGSAEKDA
ncbi:MAG: GntR family transcriptional regulator [Oscillospiraceae bacterium]|jgi:K+/H+ antiporter YhaU regulatory subunit KhtT|nr:GntR family transcriptional regulator [Oscillospiraceae bacterium]